MRAACSSDPLSGSVVDAALRPAVYWFWSRIPAPAEAARQLQEIKNAGFSTVLIQTRLSFPREQYMSAEYLSAYRNAVETAGALGLKVGVYDEYAWMSGHGGGRTVDGAEQLRERHLFWTTSGPSDPRRASISGIDSWWIDGFGGPERTWLYDDGVRRWDQWQLTAALAAPHDADTADADQPIDVTDQVRVEGLQDGCTLQLGPDSELPDGWVINAFVSARCASSRMVNYLDPETAQRFIEVVYEPYAAALAGLLGDPVEYFSFDHPYSGFYNWSQQRPAQIGNSLMWDAGMAAETARIDPCQPLARTLSQIIHGHSDRAKQLRVEFFRRYSERGIASFFAPLRAWADAHKLGLSGHELLAHVGHWGLNEAFPEVDGRANFGLDYFAIDRHRTRTLVDASNYNAQISPKFGDSLARARGRGRCVVEQYAARNDGPGHYAGGYWELRLDELRLQTLRLHLLGARQLIFHAYGQTDGSGANSDVLTNPRFDFPPTCNFEPWWAHFRAYADESAAVSAFIEAAEPQRPVALVYPLHTLWAEGPRHAHSRLVGEWAQLLATEGVGFDLIDDRALATASVADAQLHAAGRIYRAVIIAGATTMPSNTVPDVLRQLEEQGGGVIITDPDGEVPSQVPDPLRGLASSIATADAAGTLWRWEADTRVVLLNDGPSARTVTVAGRAFALEPEELACLLLTSDGVIRTGPGLNPPKGLEPALVQLDQGWSLQADGRETEIDVTRGWEQQGFASFSGEGTYRLTFDAPNVAAEPLILELPQVHCAVSATLNGVDLGSRGWRPFRFAVRPGILQREGNTLTLQVTNSAANRYYAGTPFQSGLQPSGISAAPTLRIQSTEEGP